MKTSEEITIACYDATIDEYINHNNKHHPIEDAAIFLPHLHNNAHILDLSCDPGRDAEIFIKKGFRVTGIDLSKNMVRAAKKKCPNATFHVMNTKELEFSDEKFDGVWANSSLLHISKKDISQALGEVYRVLKMGGIFYLSLKQGDGEHIISDQRYNIEAKKFFSYFRVEEIEVLLEEGGFDIIKLYVDTALNSYKTHPLLRIYCKKQY